MNLRPLFDRVVLSVDKKQEKTDSGIFLSSIGDDNLQTAHVIAVGDGMLYDGTQVKMQVKVNDYVLYSKFAGTTYKDEGREYLVVKQTDILAIIGKGE